MPDRGRPVAGRRGAPGPVGQLPGRRLHVGPRLLLPGPGRLRRVRDPVHQRVPRRAGTVITNEVALARAPAVRVHARSSPAARRSCTTSTINGQRVTNLRPVADDDREDLHGRHHELERPGDRGRQPGSCTCPNLPIRPVVRSDGSGTTAQFTAFMASQTPAVWNAYCAKVGREPQPVPVDVAVARHQRSSRSSSPTASPTSSPRRTTTARSPTSSTATPSSAASRSRRC